MSYKGWDKGTISRMVKSSVYAGTLVQGKTSITARNEKERVYKPEQEWVVTENFHEALVCKELFSKAQEICAGIERRMESCRHHTDGVPISEDIFNSTSQNEKFQIHISMVQ